MKVESQSEFQLLEENEVDDRGAFSLVTVRLARQSRSREPNSLVLSISRGYELADDTEYPDTKF